MPALMRSNLSQVNLVIPFFDKALLFVTHPQTNLLVAYDEDLNRLDVLTQGIQALHSVFA